MKKSIPQSIDKLKDTDPLLSATTKLPNKLEIKIWSDADNKPSSKPRKRRLDKKLHLNEFACTILSIDFKHDKIDFEQIEAEDEIDLLVDGVITETGFNLGFSSHSKGIKSHCCFEIINADLNESATNILQSIKKHFPKTADFSVQSYDAYYCPDEVFE
jgi:uncharacterized protein YggL (DUF469 family)